MFVFCVSAFRKWGNCVPKDVRGLCQHATTTGLSAEFSETAARGESLWELCHVIILASSRGVTSLPPVPACLRWLDYGSRFMLKLKFIAFDQNPKSILLTEWTETKRPHKTNQKKTSLWYSFYVCNQFFLPSRFDLFVSVWFEVFSKCSLMQLIYSVNF